jgi:methionyl-tRNA formyltransferase
MKILYLTNNDVSLPLFDWLQANGEEVVKFEQRLTTKFIDRVQPDFTISYNYRFLIKQRHIDQLNNRVVNLHTSLLPWNRGASPNVWSFLKETPKGVTIHEVDAGLDTGRILLQREIQFDDSRETLASSYQALHSAIQDLFKENWSEIATDSSPFLPQSGSGSSQTLAEFEAIKHLLAPGGWQVPIAALQKRYAEFQAVKRSCFTQ